MRKTLPLALCLFLVLAATAQSAKPPSFAKARAAARAALPSYVLSSCMRGSSPVVRCDMHRDARGWRYVRTVSVRSSSRPRVGAPRKLCRLAPARTDRCGFKLPRR